jgi:hypothetical protein
MAVSMEFGFSWKQAGIYDADNNVVYDPADIPQNLQPFIFRDDKNRLMIRKTTNRKIYLALGGLSGSLFYSGIGYTDKPAESTAAIEQIAASLHKRDGMVICESAAVPEWRAGVRCVWSGGEYNRGIVREVITQGSARLHGQELAAQPGNPLLRIELPNGSRILRLAHRVVKKS